MSLDAVDELVSAVIGKVDSNGACLDSAVDFALDFAGKWSLSPRTLLDLSLICDKKGMHREEYVFAKASAGLAEGKLRQ